MKVKRIHSEKQPWSPTSTLDLLSQDLLSQDLLSQDLLFQDLLSHPQKSYRV